MAEEIIEEETPEIEYFIKRDYFMGTESQCLDFIAKMDSLMGYPNAEVKTVTYAKPRAHNGNAGMFYIPLKSVNAPKLGGVFPLEDMDNAMSPDEIARKKTYEDLSNENAFVVIE